MKNLSTHGRSTLEIEVTNISSHGLWVLLDSQEFFLSYKDFPWFKDRTINEISNVENLGEGHLYWKNLDIDLSLDIIKHPERFPLQAKSSF